jgi:hypothetical protein
MSFLSCQHENLKNFCVRPQLPGFVLKGVGWGFKEPESLCLWLSVCCCLFSVASAFAAANRAAATPPPQLHRLFGMGGHCLGI